MDADYHSGDDFVVEFLDYRYAFSRTDFAQRVVAAAVRLELVPPRDLGDEEADDLVELAATGRVSEPRSALGEHLQDCARQLDELHPETLTYWLRKLVFRGAWLDQRVKEGELDIVFDPDSHAFGYVQPERDAEPIELSREPSWARLAYRR